MQAENAVLNDCSQLQVVEEGGEVLPHIGVAVLPQALIVEAVDLGDLLALVISTKNSDAVRIADFQANEEGDCLDRVLASVDIVAHEEVVVIWQLSSDVEELFKIKELTMDVTANGNWGTNRYNVFFMFQNLPCLIAKLFDLILWQWFALIE